MQHHPSNEMWMSNMVEVMVKLQIKFAEMLQQHVMSMSTVTEVNSGHSTHKDKQQHNSIYTYDNYQKLGFQICDKY